MINSLATYSVPSLVCPEVFFPLVVVVPGLFFIICWATVNMKLMFDFTVVKSACPKHSGW